MPTVQPDSEALAVFSQASRLTAALDLFESRLKGCGFDPNPDDLVRALEEPVDALHEAAKEPKGA